MYCDRLFRVNAFLIFLFSFVDTNALRCYRCLSFSCPEEPILCNSVRQFIFSQLPEVYYGFEHGIDDCPSSDIQESSLAWEALRDNSKGECDEIEEGEATCTLGRIQVTTLITDLKVNVTSHATILGCAKRKLLESTKKAAKNKNKCNLMASLSGVKNSLQHFLQVEHCSQITDMCHQNDFCINPESSVVRPFTKNFAETTSIWWTILAIAILGVFILIMTFAGIGLD